MWMTVDRTKEIPIIRQIYSQFREKILSGELKENERLPSTRELAESLRVSRNVVLEAYDLLEMEGYLVTKPQSGTYVAQMASFLPSLIPPQGKTAGAELRESVEIDLRSGIPALDVFPFKKWNAYHSEVILNSKPEVFGYGTAQGTFELRQAVCDYLLRMRGMACDPAQMIITTGSLHSFFVLSRLLCGPESCYVIEDPLHSEIKEVLSRAGRSAVTVEADDYGMKTSLLPRELNPAYLFITPSHQYPLGGTLPIQRQIELIRYARSKNCYIIEDDYDSEYRYAGTPVSTLYSLDNNHVIYVGTFSKVLFPSIRIGYMVLPPSLVDQAIHFVRYHDYFTDTVSQLALAEMLNHRDVDRHIGKMKKLYKRRRDLMIKLLSETFGKQVTIRGSETGLHIIAEFSGIEFTDRMVAALKEKGLRVYPVWRHSENPAYPKNQLILGYSHLDESSIRSAVYILSSAPGITADPV